MHWKDSFLRARATEEERSLTVSVIRREMESCARSHAAVSRCFETKAVFLLLLLFFFFFFFFFLLYCPHSPSNGYRTADEHERIVKLNEKGEGEDFINDNNKDKNNE